MIAVADINAYLRTIPNLGGTQFVGNEFAATSPDDCAYTRVTGGYAPSEWTSKAKPSFQVVLRTKLASVAETRANVLYADLHRKTEFNFGQTRVVKCVADQSAPLYLGKDESGRTLYSLNFTITTI
ncbi:minor capsid protein [Paenibacillus tuaregi]|uniref:minor capsid protein n=1 Tax=Paenibacillus tuaregi TaxID=1816681 RepID=UPI00083829F8|nr:minor capsid protein [Paenibacillus tuaregi]